MPKLTGKVPVDFAELYPRLYPLMGLSARGKFLDWWIYRQYGAFRQVCKCWYSEQPRTGNQQGWRSIFYDAVYNWRQFDDNTKNYYNVRSKRIGEYGYHRYLSYYLKANFPMIIYWEPLKQSATQNVTIPDYIASAYFKANAKKGAIVLDIDGAGAAITTGIKADLRIPFACVVKNWTLLSDVAGSLNIDVWKDTFANFPPTDADSITGGHNPYLTDETKRQDSVATGFYPSVSAGDVFRFYIDSAATLTRAHLEIEVEKD